jgi:integrase/recombinase XerD
MKGMSNFPTLLERFFSQRLMTQRQASPHTIASYRDTFRLLLGFAQKQLHKSPSKLDLSDLDAPFIGAFLNHLEKCRGVTTRTRNVRLTAIRSFFRYAAYQEPAQSEHIQRVLAIPGKRQDRPLVSFLTRPEIDALLSVPDQSTWKGRRDHALLLLALQTGLRLSEITSLCREDLVFGAGAHVHCQGKECHSYCIFLRPRHETTGTRACRQAYDLAFSLADILPVVRTGIGLGPYTGAHGASRVEPMSEPYPA